MDENPAHGSQPNRTFTPSARGLRYTIGANFSLRFDYGFPLTEGAQSIQLARAPGCVDQFLTVWPERGAEHRKGGRFGGRATTAVSRLTFDRPSPEVVTG